MYHSILLARLTIERHQQLQREAALEHLVREARASAAARRRCDRQSRFAPRSAPTALGSRA